MVDPSAMSPEECADAILKHIGACVAEAFGKLPTLAF